MKCYGVIAAGLTPSKAVLAALRHGFREASAQMHLWWTAVTTGSLMLWKPLSDDGHLNFERSQQPTVPIFHISASFLGGVYCCICLYLMPMFPPGATDLSMLQPMKDLIKYLKPETLWFWCCSLVFIQRWGINRLLGSPSGRCAWWWTGRPQTPTPHPLHSSSVRWCTPEFAVYSAA